MNNITNDQIAKSLPGMGAQPPAPPPPRSPDALTVTTDGTGRDVMASELPSVVSQRGSSSGDVVASTFNAAIAAEQDDIFNAKLADLDQKLAEVSYDKETGAALPKVTGRPRELLEKQREQFKQEKYYLSMRIIEALPRAGEQQAAQRAELEAGAKRVANIATLAETTDPTGKRIGHIEATRLIDEAQKRQLADRLVRGQ